MKLGQRVSEAAKQRISESMKRYRAAERVQTGITGRLSSGPRKRVETEAQSEMLQRHELRMLGVAWSIQPFPQTTHVYEDEEWLNNDPWRR